MCREYEYLDLLGEINKRLDKYQYDVCVEDNNVVVAAGAGSGKTQVLATRFAWLVMSKNIPCGKILTLTFTNKAAGEMYERIYQTLKFFAENSKTPEIEKKRAKQALTDFSEVHIQTLDSYCGSIVRQVANIYGIRPDFATGASEDDINKLALPFVFENRNEPCVNYFADAGKIQNFASDIVAAAVSNYTTLATEKNHFVNKLQNQIKEICDAWNEKVIGNMEDIEAGDSFFQVVSRLNNTFEELDDDTKKDDFGQTVNKILSVFSKLNEELGKNVNSYEKIKIHTQEDFSKSETKLIISKIKEIIGLCMNTVLSRKKIYADINGYIKILRNKEGGLGTFYLSITSYIEQFKYIKNLCELLDKFTTQVNDSKRKSGNLSFTDVSELSLRILIENKELRKQEKNAYERIMIDEFQDNNAENRDLLFLLSEKEFDDGEYGCHNSIPTVSDIKPDKLFFVGDEKQSIYKFRGADVQVFNNLKNDLGKTLQMNNNYRSSPELISCFNKLFGHEWAVFDNNNEVEYEAKYLPVNFAKKYNPVEQTDVELPEITVDNSKIHAYLLNTNEIDKDTQLSDKDQQGFFIAKKISEIYQQDNKNCIKDSKKEQKTHYSDFAILDKSRTSRPAIIKWLNYFEIPYTLDQNSSLFSDGPINDIYNLCRICVYEADLNAFAAYLASPFANLAETSIETVLCFEDHRDETIKEQIGSEEYKRYKAALDRYDSIRQQILSQSLTKTLITLWNNYGYCYETMLNEKVALYAEQFDMLFELARQTDDNGKSPAWFVDQLAQIKNNEKSVFGTDTEMNAKEITYPLEKDDAVQIMTIHKSKGLQFNYVFVCGCTGASAKSDRSKLFYEDETGLSIVPDEKSENYFSIKQKEMETAKDLAEFRRVIYVAITRAKKEVFIVGSWNPESTSTSDFRLFENYLKTYNPEQPDDLALDFHEIELQNKSVLWQTPAKENISKLSFNQRITKVCNIYNNSKTDKLEIIPNFRSKPSELELDNDLNSSKFTESQSEKLSKLNTIIEKYIPEDQKKKNKKDNDGDDAKIEQNDEELTHDYFDYSDFGTLAHKFLEDYVNSGLKPDFSENDFTGGIKLFKNLEDNDKAEIIKCCLEMANNFGNSELGKQIKSAYKDNCFVKTEWTFRMYTDGLLFTGSMDLIFQNSDGTYTLVDYKTDQNKNNEKYVPQQKCYRTAAANMLKISEDKIICKLFYLRYAHEETLNIL